MTKFSHSAGGIVVNPQGQVLVVNQHHNSWSLPKGHLDPGEDTFTAAKREIWEESGVSKLTLIEELGTYSRYKIGLRSGENKKVKKQITLFLFTTTEIALAPQDPENPEARWVDPEKVEALLTHPKDKVFYASCLEKVKLLHPQV